MCVYNVVANATDPEDNTISYQWQFKNPGSADWSDFGTNSPTATTPDFTTVGTYDIRCQIGDGVNLGVVSNELQVEVLEAVNRPPTVNITFDDMTTENKTCQL